MIKILKQSLEVRIDELGLDNLFNQNLSKPSKPPSIKNKIDLFLEIIKIKNEMKKFYETKIT